LDEDKSPLSRELLKKVRRIEIRTTRMVNEVFSGEYHSIFKGLGMEFSEVREYQPGDDIRNIDWNVTARYGHPYLKVYREERELVVMLVVDLSGSQRFGTGQRFKTEAAAEISAILSLAAIKNNDKVGLLAYTDKIELFIPPKKGKNHVLRLIREILYFKPEGYGTDTGQALEYLLGVVKKKCVMFLISDFIDENYRKPLGIAAKKHDLIALKLTDPLEISFPKAGLLRLYDLEKGVERIVDSSSRKFRENHRRRIRDRNEMFDKTMKRMGIDTVYIPAGGDYSAPLVRFFETRARRIRR
jgi:uncharacterized protein (DUF58 family)